MMKNIFKAVTLAITTLLTAGCSDEPAKVEITIAKNITLTKVKAGDLRSEFWLPLYVAKEKGYFQEEGLDVELILFKDGPIELQSALNGEIDFAVLSTEPVLIAYEKGLKSKILMATLKNKPFMLVANKDIHNFEDLRGKNIAAGTPGSSPYAFILSILKKNNLNPMQDVNLVNMDYGASLVALNNNQIQATFLDSTRINQSDLDSTNVLVDTANPETHLKIYGTDKYEASIVVASETFINKNPKTTQQFANAMVKAMKWQQENSDEAIASLVKPYFADLDMLDVIQLTRSSLSVDGMISAEGYQAMEKFALDEGLIKSPIPFENIVDLQYVTKAQEAK